MIFTGRALAIAGVLTLGLSGCVTVLPKAQPVQLYSFGHVAPAADRQAPGVPPTMIVALPTAFPMAVAGDRILTTRGLEAAYLARARWVSTAQVLFDDTEVRAFAASPGAARLLRRDQGDEAALGLRLDVQTFEARFVADQPAGRSGAAPTVVVAVRAELSRLADRKVVASRIFQSRQPADAGRIGAIVAAFDRASVDVLNQVVAWTDLTVRAPG